MGKIFGVDYSVNSPSVVKIEVDENLKEQSISYIGFSSVKKVAKLDKNIVYYDKSQFLNNFEKNHWFRNMCIEFMGVSKRDFVGIENYAFGANGRVFSIAESTYAFKDAVYMSGASIRLLEPSLIKKFSTGKGNANKRQMFVSFHGTNDSSLLKHLPESSPQEDIIDAFFVAKMLLMELKVRKGLIDLKTLSPKQIECFSAVSKSNPENLLVRKFIQKP